jgi:hypothetical protein
MVVSMRMMLEVEQVMEEEIQAANNDIEEAIERLAAMAQRMQRH